MANLCLPKSFREKMSKALKEGDISLEKLYLMTDKERHTLFKNYVGDDFATLINSKFEQAMISNQNSSLANWVEKTLNASDPVRRDLMKKIGKLDKILSPGEEADFLGDLAETKLGIGVSKEEAQKIVDMKKQVDDLKVQVPEGAPARSPERMAYGYAVDNFKEFVGKLKNDANALTLKEYAQPGHWKEAMIDMANATKAAVSTLDDSFIGRQGIKTLLSGEYKIWADTALKSFKDLGQQLVAKSNGLFKGYDDAVMASTRADIYSRPNALNGKYKAAKNGYGLGLLHEESFPTSLPEKIPGLGRIFKASETAYNGSAMKMRADLADAIISNAEANGVDMLDEAQASSFGKLVSSMTGRGNLGKGEAVAKEINAALFSIKFLKSNFDTLTAHLFDKTMTKEAKIAAVKSTLKIAATVNALLLTAKAINPDSVDFDPRKGSYGKIKFGNHQYDITGGLGGLVTLGSRIVPTMHNGQWGLWNYSKNTGKWVNGADAGFGEQSAFDSVVNFISGKLSPAAGVVRDVLKGQNFNGEKPGFVNTALGLITPISAQNLMSELKKGNDDILWAMMAEAIGISQNDTASRFSGKKWDELKTKKGEEVFNKASREATDKFNAAAEKLQKQTSFKKASTEDQNKKLQALRTEVINSVLGRY